MKYNKYSNIKTVIDGIKFDSRKEANHYCELKLLLRQGAIKDLVLQPRFELQPSFKLNGKTIRKIEYVADFQYMEEGKIIVEDVKGVKTDIFQMKLKMLLYRYPNINFKII